MTQLAMLVLLYFNACVYLAPLWRYGASNIVGSQPWPFGSRDHSTRGGRLPMGGPLWRYI